MNPRRPLLALCLLLATALVPAAQAQRRSVVSVGDVPCYRFEAPLLGGQGVERLEHLRGRPVLIDFWGVKCPPCIGFAVPKAMKLKKLYGEDLVVLFVESQGTSFDDMAAFALEKRWLGSGALWTTERVFDSGLRSLPHSALLSARGEVVLSGYTREISRELDLKIEELVQHSRQGPPGTPDSLKPAWAAMSEGAYSKALAIARRIAANSTDEDAELGSEALSQFTQRAERDLKRAEWQLDNGFLLEGLLQLERLAQGLGGEDWLLAKVERLIREVGSRSTEMKAAQALQQLEANLYANGPSEKMAAALTSFAEEYRGLPASERALWLASLIDGSECSSKPSDR